MGQRVGSRVAILVVGVLFLIVAWRLQSLKSAQPSDPSGPASAPISEGGSSSVRDLTRDEQLGGHTLARHVGRSADELAERLEREGGIAAASSFVDRATAEEVVGRTLARERSRVASWLRRDRGNLTLDYRGTADRTIGWVLLRGASRPVAASDARIVLRQRGEDYFVLTSYPVEP